MWRCCEAMQPEIAGLYRQLHRIPEVGKQLPETAAFVCRQLDRLKIPYVRSACDDSILAVIDTGKPGKTVLLRADMDALEIQEETGLPYASCHPGAMHACGHDAHTAMLLGAAAVLQAHRQQLTGWVKLLFQTDEESVSGARPLIGQGWLEGVDAVFGLHIGSLMGAGIPSGTVIAAPGCCMASVDHFRIEIQGKGCHGSSPEKGIDPIHIAAHLILALQTLANTASESEDRVILTVGSIHGGSQGNVIPDRVQLLGSMRCISPVVREAKLQALHRLTRQTAQRFGGSAAVEILSCAPPLVNHRESAAFAAACAAEVVGRENVIIHLDHPNMGSEDFAYYLEKVPGAFVFLSSADREKGTDIPHHNARFSIDESVLWKGSALLTALAAKTPESSKS